jgi:hypothetical protein
MKTLAQLIALGVVLSVAFLIIRDIRTRDAEKERRAAAPPPQPARLTLAMTDDEVKKNLGSPIDYDEYEDGTERWRYADGTQVTFSTQRKVVEIRKYALAPPEKPEVLHDPRNPGRKATENP